MLGNDQMPSSHFKSFEVNWVSLDSWGIGILHVSVQVELTSYGYCGSMKGSGHVN